MFSFSIENKLTVVFLLLLLVAACTTIPAQEMSDARQALQAADQVNAADKAAIEYQEARRLLELAQSEIKANNYYEAKRLATAAKEAALRARTLSIE